MPHSEYKPMHVSPPGDTIADILEERGLTSDDLASLMVCPVRVVGRLLAGDEALSNELAAKLAVALGAPAEFWLRREAHYRESKCTTT